MHRDRRHETLRGGIDPATGRIINRLRPIRRQHGSRINRAERTIVIFVGAFRAHKQRACARRCFARRRCHPGRWLLGAKKNSTYNHPRARYRNPSAVARHACVDQ